MKNLFSIHVILIFLVCSIQNANPQGFSTSRYDADPLNLNPSHTGDFNGSWRVTINYNELKTLSIPFNNYMISYDQPVFIKGRKIGLGVSALHDETGNNIYNKEKIYLSGSFFQTLGSNYLKVGLQAGYITSNLKLENELWPDQYNQILGTFDPSSESGENIENNISYIDLNIGTSWRRVFARHIPEFGISLNHINSPKVSYISGNIKLKPVLTIHATNDWTISPKVYITPVFIYKTNLGENYMNYGMACSYKLSGSFPEKSVFTGIDLKNSFSSFNACSFYGGLNYNQWQVGVSYDYNIIGAKNNLSVRGPLEIYIRYTALSSRLQNFSVPCSRF
jgi:type IX secretion system PorP/SprF family membrane protein